MNPLNSILLVVVSILMPVFVGAGSIHWMRSRARKSGRRSPIVGKVICGAGEQLRKRILDEDVALFSTLAIACFTGPYVIAIWALPRVDWTHAHFGLPEALYCITVVSTVVWAARKLMRHWRNKQNATDGLRAELFVAQELNRLLGKGCSVIHDVPADGFNIDHVVIGRHRVYAIETKSFRKPSRVLAGDSWRVAYDGKLLRFPDFSTMKPLKQAEQQARWLRRELKTAIDTEVPVVAAVALPGWFIESAQAQRNYAVQVFTPVGGGASFMADETNEPAFDGPTIALIKRALLLRFPGSE